MFVVKRDGHREPVAFDKILRRIAGFCTGLDPIVDPVTISQETITGLFSGITTVALDTLSADIAASKAASHPDFAVLAARLTMSNLHKQTPSHFSDAMERLYRDGTLAEDLIASVRAHRLMLDAAINHKADFGYGYFGIKTLEKGYLLKDAAGHTVERPQYMLMRVALALHGVGPDPDMDRVLTTYDELSRRLYTHASPTLYNAGTTRSQLSSCFLLTMKDDSLDGIYETLHQCARISKTAGGIGLSVSDIRASGTRIKGTNGKADGLVKMLRVFDATATYVNQGGHRPGSFAMYLEPWHADVFAFLDLKKNTGKDEVRARNLFYAMWIPDLFMKRVKENGPWSLMCPHECPGLTTCWGQAFETLYTQYEKAGKARQTVPAQKLWGAILASQIETGMPYMLYKDACNAKSNHQHLGCIKNSNLCAEIVEYCAPDEVAVCNLASVCLPEFISSDEEGKPEYDHRALGQVVRNVIRNLDRVIDINLYPVPEARNSNLRHRPVGLGVQGLADTFLKLRLPFDSPEARALNKAIFETIYFNALTASCDLAREKGTYASYPGSPISQGRLQPDLWGVSLEESPWAWEGLRADIQTWGVRNSLLVAPMPTASTAQILGWNEAFEPYTTNLYVRRVLAGEFQVVNTALVRDLIALGLWDEPMRQELMAHRGSVQGIARIPLELKRLYKTVWELSQRVIVDMAADRGPFIDQTQSLNIFMREPNFAKLTSLHFYAWKAGLKTGMYYLRTEGAAQAIQFTVASGQKGGADKDPSLEVSAEKKAQEEITCSLTNKDACVSCSG